MTQAFEPLSKLEYDPTGGVDYSATERKLLARMMDSPGLRWSDDYKLRQARTTINHWIGDAMGELPTCRYCGTPVTMEFHLKEMSHIWMSCTKCEQEHKDDRKGYHPYATGKEVAEELAKMAGEMLANHLLGGDRLSWRQF